MNRFHLYLTALCLFVSLQAKSQNTTLVDTGDEIIFALPAATLATTIILGDTRGSWQFTNGLILTEIISFGLKTLVDKPRPNQSDQNSFPSAHISTSFHSAAFVHRRYCITYAIPAYALAGFTGLSYIYGERHDGFDVLIDAVIDIGCS
jgi:hypothetical protein